MDWQLVESIYVAATKCTDEEARDYMSMLRSPDHVLSDYGVAKTSVFAFNFDEKSF